MRLLLICKGQWAHTTTCQVVVWARWPLQIDSSLIYEFCSLALIKKKLKENLHDAQNTSTNKKLQKISGWNRANYPLGYQFYQLLIQNDQLLIKTQFSPKSFLVQNFKKIWGSKYENFKKLNSGILINLRNFWDSNSGIHKNVEPDPLTLVFL